MRMYFLQSGSHKQVHRVKLYIHLCSEKKIKYWLLCYSPLMTQKGYKWLGKSRAQLRKWPLLQGEGQIERGENFGGNSFHVSGMEIKIERVLMPEITVHLSRTPATRDIKDLFQMRRLSEKLRLCGIVTTGNTILYSFLYFDCSGTWKVLEGVH